MPLALTLVSVTSLLAKEGHATARWVAESHQIEPGARLSTVVELKVDPGWHVYWINPGEAGMPTTASWTLPEGVSCGPLIHPWPISFRTGMLHGYGHEGIVRYPVTVAVPDDFSGEATLLGTVNWLACNDDSCVPGSAEIQLVIRQGRFLPTPESDLVHQAHFRAITPAAEGMRLEVGDGGDHWNLAISGERAASAVGARAMMATPEFSKPGEPIRFRADADGKAVARVVKSAYAPKQPESAEIWLWPKSFKRPISLVWQNRQEK